MLRCPAAKGGRAAGLVHQGHQDAQHDQKHQDAHIAAVGQFGDHAALFVEEEGIQGQFQVSVGIQQCARGDAHQQGGVHLLGVQGQHNGNDRRQQREEGAVHRTGVGRRVGDLAGSSCRAPQQQGKHEQCRRPGQILVFHNDSFSFQAIRSGSVSGPVLRGRLSPRNAKGEWGRAGL